MNIIYKCPVCGKELIKTGNTFGCAQKHSYDISSDGYVNLLLANQKRTKDPGDNRAMVENRKYFLEQGYYNTFAGKLNEIILECIDGFPASVDNSINILDLGCGEGFYSTGLRTSLQKISEETKRQVQLWGIDISKAAIQKAAKRDPQIQFCIGSNFQLPYLDESFDLIFSIFSPFDSQKLKKVLKPGGKLMVVRPGPNHLKELASLIYEKFEPQGTPLNVDLDLKPLKTFEIHYQIHLKTPKDIESLVGMTPYQWSLDQEKKLLLSQQTELITTVDFQISVFQK